MTPVVTLTDTVLHDGFQRNAGDDLDVDEATAQSLLERGLAFKPGGTVPSTGSAWHNGLDKDALLKLAKEEGVDGVKGTMGPAKLIGLIEAHRAAGGDVIHGDLRARDYDSATPEQIGVFVGAADQEYAKAVLAYEREHQKRDDVIALVEARLDDLKT